MSEKKPGAASKWRIAIFTVVGVMIGFLLAPTSVYSHVGGTVLHLWNDHIKPKADARYPTRDQLTSNGGAGIHYGNLTNVPSDGLLKTTSINGDCGNDVSGVGASFVKIGDIGSFAKEASNSIIQVTFHGRVDIDEITGGTKAIFELRVDDAAPSDGRARGLVAAEVDTDLSMTGVFRGLSPGAHDVSMWVQVPNGTGNGAK